MITLKSDNRALTSNAKYSYLITNYSAGVSSIKIINTEDFVVDSFIIISEVGKSDAEIFRIGTINTTTGEITLKNSAGNGTTTRFAHPESTKVATIPYDQIRFYWTAALGTLADETPVFDNNTPLTSYVDLEPAALYTTYDDSGHSTGFGWFLYYNSVSTQSSQPSNPIPYAGFVGNSVAAIFADFDSLLNTNELKLVSIMDKFSWLNESLAVLKNKLNLTNVEYTVSDRQTLNVVAGTAEYSLPVDFSDLVEISDNAPTFPTQIDFISLAHVLEYNGTQTKYYLRNRYIGLVPTPTTNATFYYRYRAKAVAAVSISTYIDLPDNAFYVLKDWMMYRACQKFNNPMAQQYYQSFTNSVNLYMQSAVKRNANLDTWEPAHYANV
jgi:hypothetical protein